MPPPEGGFSAPPPLDQPAKKKTPAWVWWLIGLLGLGACSCVVIPAALLAPVFGQANLAAKKTKALTNVKLLATALQIYAADYDDRFPVSEWATNIDPYTDDQGGDSLLLDPRLPDETRPGIGFNADLLGISTAEINNPAGTVLLFSTQKFGKNSTGGSSDLRLTNGEAIIGFSDGAVRVLKEGLEPSLVWTAKTE
ncbi:MAG: hypothetical protein MUC92_05435 [Fimbriimonadaceae bacterium]|nr:hypothetical protein [Fimbriimonadaceae bacterium]